MLNIFLEMCMATIFLESCWAGVASSSAGVINDARIINTEAEDGGGI